MAIKPIVQIPDPVLTTPCKKVGEVNDEIKQLIKDLIDTLDAQTDPQGTGIAAPQIGVSKQVCIVRRWYKNEGEEETYKDYVLINPEILGSSSATDIYWEACLSIPDLFGKVQRHKRVRVRALDENGETVKIKASGFFSRVIQHEIDHLHGVLFSSKIIGEALTEDELDSKYKAQNE